MRKYRYDTFPSTEQPLISRKRLTLALTGGKILRRPASRGSSPHNRPYEASFYSLRDKLVSGDMRLGSRREAAFDACLVAAAIALSAPSASPIMLAQHVIARHRRRREEDLFPSVARTPRAPALVWHRDIAASSNDAGGSPQTCGASRYRLSRREAYAVAVRYARYISPGDDDLTARQHRPAVTIATRRAASGGNMVIRCR